MGGETGEEGGRSNEQKRGRGNVESKGVKEVD